MAPFNNASTYAFEGTPALQSPRESERGLPLSPREEQLRLSFGAAASERFSSSEPLAG